MAQVKNPHAIFIDGDDEYVVGDNGILMPLTDPPACPFTPLESAQCVAAVRGVTYVGMTDHVLVLDPANKKSEWAKIEGTPHVTSIAATEKDVFVADAGNRVLWHYDTSGKLLGTIGKADKAKGIDGFIVPSPHFKIAIAPDGLLRVANPGRLCVEAYTVQGDLEWRWGQAGTTDAGFSGCCNPAALAIFPDGRIVTAEKGELAMVKVFSPDANGQASLQAIVAGPAQFPELKKLSVEMAPDVAVDRNGWIHVLDPATAKIRIFRPKQAGTSSHSTVTTRARYD